MGSWSTRGVVFTPSAYADGTDSTIDLPDYFYESHIVAVDFFCAAGGVFVGATSRHQVRSLCLELRRLSRLSGFGINRRRRQDPQDRSADDGVAGARRW